MKSIHFNQVPDMRGKKTMPFTDVLAFNAKEKFNEQMDWILAERELIFLHEDSEKTAQSTISCSRDSRTE